MIHPTPLPDDLKQLRADEAADLQVVLDLAQSKYIRFMSRWGDDPCDEVDEIRRKTERFGELQ